MKIDTLQKQIEDFNNGKTKNPADFIPFLIVEQFFQSKIDAFYKEVETYQKYLSTLIHHPCTITFKNPYYFKISYSTLTAKKEIGIVVDTEQAIGKDKICAILNQDETTKKFIATFIKFTDAPRQYLGIPTNIGLFLHILIENFNHLKILLSDRNHNTIYARSRMSNDLPTIFYNQFVLGHFYLKAAIQLTASEYKTKDDEENFANFYYYKDPEKREIHYENEQVKEFINEKELGKICAGLTIDPSCFEEELQAELRQFYINHRLGLEQQKSEEMEILKKMQLERIMKAYQLLKEALALIKDLKEEFPIERLRIDQLETILFKNNGMPNQDNYIEFEDLFKNNSILRMLDLSGIDLTNVDIRGIDFSYCNIHIDPQTIYKKDMTNVNAIGVKFSPWTDSFVDVVLDGAKINDREANIVLEQLRSYNEQTLIQQEDIPFSKRYV